MSTVQACRYVPLYKTRVVVYLLSIALSAIAIGAVFNGRTRSSETKKSAQAAVDQLTPGVKLTIDTSDVYVAGEVEGVAQLGLALLGLGCLGLLLLDTRKRFAVANAPHVQRAPWSSKTLPLQVLCYALAVLFTFATSIVTTVFVATRQAKVTSRLPNGQLMPDSLVQAFSAKLGISPIYKERDYLVFMAASPWPAVLIAIVGLVVSIVAWRRHSTYRSEAQAQAERTTSWTSTEKYQAGEERI